MASLVQRGKKFYIQYYVGGRMRRKSLDTDSRKIAKAKLTLFESKRVQGEDNPLPSKTPTAEIVNMYVEYIRLTKSPKGAQTDIYYLRQMFGVICPALEITSRKTSVKAQKRPVRVGRNRRTKHPIEVNYFEEISTSVISDFIAVQVRTRGLAPKTANRYREILNRIFNWAMKDGRIKMPGNRNPASAVERYKEHAPEIRFLTLAQIDEQLEALKDSPQLQAMAALYIYAGLRREEALWLQHEDVALNAGKYGMIRIRPKTVGEESWQSKTRKNRAVPISSTLRYYLDRYTPRPSDGGWFFPSPKGSRYEPDNFSRDFRLANKAAGLSWSCLDFRHTFGSQLAMKGESLYKISTLMGNSPEICRRHYAALIPEAMVCSVEFRSMQEKSEYLPLKNRFSVASIRA